MLHHEKPQEATKLNTKVDMNKLGKGADKCREALQNLGMLKLRSACREVAMVATEAKPLIAEKHADRQSVADQRSKTEDLNMVVSCAHH